jgi:hypothetical protein
VELREVVVAGIVVAGIVVAGIVVAGIVVAGIVVETVVVVGATVVDVVVLVVVVVVLGGVFTEFGPAVTLAMSATAPTVLARAMWMPLTVRTPPGFDW